MSIKIADGDIDALLAIEDLRTLDQIKTIKDSLSANESQIQPLSLIYTDNHPKLAKAYDYKFKLNKQLEDEINLGIEQKAFELSNLDGL